MPRRQPGLSGEGRRDIDGLEEEEKEEEEEEEEEGQTASPAEPKGREKGPLSLPTTPCLCLRRPTLGTYSAGEPDSTKTVIKFSTSRKSDINLKKEVFFPPCKVGF